MCYFTCAKFQSTREDALFYKMIGLRIIRLLITGDRYRSFVIRQCGLMNVCVFFTLVPSTTDYNQLIFAVLPSVVTVVVVTFLVMFYVLRWRLRQGYMHGKYRQLKSKECIRNMIIMCHDLNADFTMYTKDTGTKIKQKIRRCKHTS